MPIMPRYLDKLRNKFAGTGLYDDQDEFSQGFMADSAGPTGSFRKDSMVAQEPPPLPAQSELPPATPLAPFSDMPSDNPDTDNPMLTAQQGPPPPPRGIAGPPTPEQLMAERAAMKAPEVSKPSKWQMLAAAGIGGLQGYKNAARPQDRPMDLDIQSIVRPNLTRQMGDYSRKAKDLDSRIKTAGDVEQISTNKAYREGIVADRKDASEDRARTSTANGEKRLTDTLISLASAGGKVVDPASPVTQNHERISFGGKTYDVPQKGMVTVRNKDVAEFLGIKPGEQASSEDHTKALEIAGRLAELRAKSDPKEQENLNHWVAVSADPKSTPEERAVADAKIKRYGGAQQAIHVSVNAANPNAGPSKPIERNSPEFRVAQDMASGDLTMSQFSRLYSRSTDANKRVAIYDMARELNPNFNPASFESGYSFAKSPKVKAQVAALNNVDKGVGDLLKFSDKASRSGATILNKAILPGGVAIGGKPYTNFHTARIAFADELSGALGYGSATDMAKQMGLDITDANLSPENFRAAIEDVVVPFVARKRASILEQMGPYGQQQAAPTSSGDGMISVQIPGQPPGKIPAANKDAFLKAHPGAKVQ